MNNNFCTRCGSHLNENGICPNCGTSYNIEEVFDEPQIVEDTYNTADSGVAVEADNVGNAEEVPSNDSYSADSYGYANQPDTYNSYVPQPEQNYGVENGNYSNYGNNTDHVGAQSAEQQESQSAAQKKSVSFADYLKDWLDCMMSFFKEEPFAAVDKVLDGGAHLWVKFAGLNVIFSAFCIAGMFGNGFVWLVDRVFGSYAMLISFYKSYTFGNIFVLFLFSLLTVVLLFCAVTGCEYALFSLSQKKVRIEKLIRTVAISFFPMTIACAGAYIFSFFLMRVAGTIILAGAIVSFRLLNEAVRREAGELPFWNVVLCNIAQAIVTVIIVSITLAVV